MLYAFRVALFVGLGKHSAQSFIYVGLYLQCQKSLVFHFLHFTLILLNLFFLYLYLI